MSKERTIVLDVGKTMSKLTLWTADATLLERRTYTNRPVVAAAGYLALDVEGVRAWMLDTLGVFASLGPVGQIVPVSHGAGAAVLRDGELVCPPMDYEDAISSDDRTVYDQLRDDFAATGSPRLPDGLNLGAQLFRLGRKIPGLFAPGAMIVTLAQYWAHVLSGVAATEATSLGCHTDLWRPIEAKPSALVGRLGLSACLAPLRPAADVLGPIRPDLAAATGLPPETRVHCGLHDSNAALLAARSFPEIGGHDATVLSTGTWFVAMRSPSPGAEPETAMLREHRDCLVNIDADGRPVPSARFMGGREIELLTGLDIRRIDIRPDQPRLLAAVCEVVDTGAMVLPTFAPGLGPFPNSRGRWVAQPTDPFALRATVSLYAALMADVSLELVGARDRILVEGRFAEAQVFVRALASLRPDATIYRSHAHNDVSFGALRLLDPSLRPTAALQRVEPLPLTLDGYRALWRRHADELELAA